MNSLGVWQQFLANSKSGLSRRLSFGECFFETQRSQREHTQSSQRTLCELCAHLCELCVSKKTSQGSSSLPGRFGTPLACCDSLLPYLWFRQARRTNRRRDSPRAGPDGRMPCRLLGLLSHRAQWARGFQSLADSPLVGPVGMWTNANFCGNRRSAQATP